jgi:hypothetical protein
VCDRSVANPLFFVTDFFFDRSVAYSLIKSDGNLPLGSYFDDVPSSFFFICTCVPYKKKIRVFDRPWILMTFRYHSFFICTCVP